jgi:hypothetical protein
VRIKTASRVEARIEGNDSQRDYPGLE